MVNLVALFLNQEGMNDKIWLVPFKKRREIIGIINQLIDPYLKDYKSGNPISWEANKTKPAIDERLLALLPNEVKSKVLELGYPNLYLRNP